MMVALLALYVQIATSGAAERPLRSDTTEVRVVARVRPDTVFVGQATQYELSVFIRDDVRRRLRRNPEYVPPELRGLVGYDFRDRDSVVRVTQNGVEYEVHRFTRTLFPVAAGAHEVAAARLTYAVPLGPSFFSREESRVLRSARVTVIAVEPPAAGRPTAWDGAVGDLAVSVATIPRAVRRGDPFVLTLRVSGRGHIPLLPRPTLAIPWASTVASDERVQFTVVERALRGVKEFDWLVTPAEDGALTLPAIEYSYFDPERRIYRTIRTEPTAVRVQAAGVPIVVADAADSLQTTPTASPLALRPWSRETPRWPGRAWWFWSLIGVAPMPALLAAVRQRRRRGDGARSTRLARLSDQATPAERRAHVHAVLTERFAATALPWETTDRAIALLRREGVTTGTAQAVMELVSRLDTCCYGASDAAPPTVASIRSVLGAVLREARPRQLGGGRSQRRAASLLLISAMLVHASAVVVHAQGAAGAAVRDRFAVGQAVIDTDPHAAADAFFAAARQAPRVTPTWYNAAAASWRAADTARAVVAWQRVLRLAPRDAEARAALRRVGAWRAAPPAMVWGIPVTTTAIGALLLWCGGWLWLARRPGSWLGRAGLVAAVGMAALAFQQQRRLDDPRVGVIARPSAVRPLPALAADGGLLALTGEVVFVREATPVWLRIEAADGRSGWVDARDVLTLDARPWRD